MRLSVAQQRIIDAMKDGADLFIRKTPEPWRPGYYRRRTLLSHFGKEKPVNPQTFRRLLKNGAIRGLRNPGEGCGKCLACRMGYAVILCENPLKDFYELTGVETEPSGPAR